MRKRGRLQIVESWTFSQSMYSRQGCGKVFLLLACGHEKGQKASIQIPKKARCPECPR